MYELCLNFIQILMYIHKYLITSLIMNFIKEKYLFYNNIQRKIYLSFLLNIIIQKYKNSNKDYF
jgi:hypothetical protein